MMESFAGSSTFATNGMTAIMCPVWYDSSTRAFRSRSRINTGWLREIVRLPSQDPRFLSSERSPELVFTLLLLSSALMLLYEASSTSRNSVSSPMASSKPRYSTWKLGSMDARFTTRYTANHPNCSGEIRRSTSAAFSVMFCVDRLFTTKCTLSTVSAFGTLMFWFDPAASSVSRFSDVANPEPPPLEGAAGPRFAAPPAELRSPEAPESRDESSPEPPPGFIAGMDCACCSPPPSAPPGGAPGGAGGLGVGGGGAALAPTPVPSPARLTPATPAARLSGPSATEGSSLPSRAAPLRSAAAPRSAARSGCAFTRCGTAARCWQYCGHSGSLCLNCSSASEPKANILVPKGLRSASRTQRSATPSVMLATSCRSMSRPNSTAVTRSSLSGYLGKNLYSSNRLCTMHPKTSRSRASRDARNRASISAVCSAVRVPEYSRWKLALASASTSAGKEPPADPTAPPPTAPPPPGTATGAPPPLAAAAASVGCARAAAAATTWSSWRRSGGSPPAPACSVLKKMAIVSTASLGEPGVGAPASSPVARARRNRRHAAAKGAPLAAARACSHFSRLRYSRRAASAASSTASACGALSSAAESALRSWHTSSMRGTAGPPSRSCVAAIAIATHS